jgi:hypothetical protein
MPATDSHFMVFLLAVSVDAHTKVHSTAARITRSQRYWMLAGEGHLRAAAAAQSSSEQPGL